jgi:signal transduction histidine kinase
VRHEAPSGEANRQVSARFSRQLSLALLGGIVLMVATVMTAWWMAGQQDGAAREAARRMVEGGIESFVDRTRRMVLDYAIWTDAYERIRAGDVDWMHTNIGSSVDIGTFDLVVVLPPRGEPAGWATGGGSEPVEDLLEPAAMAAAVGALEAAAPEDGTAVITYARSGGALWLLAAARVVPQDGLPPEAGDADLPRLVIGQRVTTSTFDAIRNSFQIENLAVSDRQPADRDGVPLDGVEGQPLAWVSWSAPTPGRAVLRAALLPLVALMLAVASVAVIVSRELVRSARRLEAALDQVRAADRTKTEFLANVSHELRTPLNGVIGIAQLLKLRQHEPEVREMVDILLASAHAQLELVNRLLDTARIESGAMRIDRLPFQPASVLDQTARLIAPEIARKGLTLDIAISPEARREVLGDALAFRQVTANLIGNALKFTERGGIAVELGIGEEGALCLAITDTGSGIDPAEHQRIFERFVQVDGSSTRQVGGAGLGLAITRGLVELMGGSIEVRSAPGQGASFIVTLPLPEVPARPLAAAA